MHKLIEYVCDELKELERKADKEGKLSAAEVQYMDVLAHAKKNLLTGEAMMEADGEYSNSDGSYRGGSYRGGSYRNGSYMMDGNDGSYRGRSYAGRRNARRDSMGRYSGNGYSRSEEMVDELRELMQDAPDDRTRQEFQRFIQKIESMG